jgi:copper resistance protein C
MIDRCARAAALLLGLVCLTSTAQAHSHLTTSVPAAVASASSAPSEIRLQFDESIEAIISYVSVERSGGPAVAAGAVVCDPNDHTALVLRLAEPVPAGAYKVNWRVISADTHGQLHLPRATVS